MPRYILLFYLFFLIGTQSISYGQEVTSKDLDSLVKLDFEELEDKFYENIDTNRPITEAYAKAYLQKGKKIGDTIKMAKGFYSLARFYMEEYKKSIIYVDSAIAITHHIKHNRYPIIFYVNKGVISEINGFFDKALDYYLQGLTFAKQTNNLHFTAILQHNIALLKRKLGKFEEAKIMLKQCLAYEKSMIGKKKNDTTSYLLTLAELVTTYRKNKEIDSALQLNTQGLKMSKENDMECLFRLRKGILKYYVKDYEGAINTITQGLDELQKSKYFTSFGRYNLKNGYLFLGKSYAAVSKKELAIKNYKKLDSVIVKNNYYNPEIRPAYVEIINYYKSKGDTKNQLLYIDKLLYNDSVQNHNFKYISNRLIKEYDTPLLLSRKEQLISELKTKNNQSTYGLILSSIIILIISSILLVSYQKNKRYKKRFNELMNNTRKEVVIEQHENKIIKALSPIAIAEEVVEMIIKELDKFEKNNGFLEVNITSTILAKKINTNSKYLTKVIKYYRKKSFSPYINDLRIDYITTQLKIDRKLQKYTIKALAKEAGFNSAEVFSKYFFKKTGIYPSYFIKRLQAQEN